MAARSRRREGQRRLVPSRAGRSPWRCSPPIPENAHPWAKVAAVLVAAIALATLVEYLGVNLGIDQLFAKDLTSAGSPHPGRFAVLTAFGFLAAALAILSIGRRARGIHLSEPLAVVSAAIGGVSLMGYMYGADALIGPESVNQVALPAAVALTLLAVGLIAVDPEHALTRQVIDPGPAGQVIRRILPAAILIVPVGAWLRLMGERAGLYDESVGLSILVTLEALVLVAIGAWTTANVRRLVGAPAGGAGPGPPGLGRLDAADRDGADRPGGPGPGAADTST